MIDLESLLAESLCGGGRTPCRYHAAQARLALNALEGAGYIVHRPHDWKYPRNWPYNKLDPVVCRRCGRYQHGLGVEITDCESKAVDQPVAAE